MRTTRLQRTCVVATAMLALTAHGASAQQQPVKLTLANGNGLDGHRLAMEFTQVVQFGGQHGGAEVVREARLHFRFEQGQSIDAERSSTSVVLDSSRATAVSPHGREVIDTRRIAGTSVRGVYTRSGGPPQWEKEGPAIVFGLFGSVPILTLLDYAFPTLNSSTVREGDQWESRWVRRQLDGNGWTETAVTTRYTLERLTSQHGVSLARIAFTTQANDRSVALRSTGYVVLRINDGLIHDLSLDESISGEWDMNGTSAPYTQTTTLRAMPSAGQSMGG